MNLRADIDRSAAWFVDTTLRDGEQAAGVVFSDAHRVGVARRLLEVGVREMEVGIPASGEEARRQIRLVAAAVPEMTLLAWCRGRMEDLDAAARCPVAGVHLSFPVSDLHLRIWGKSRQWAIDHMLELTSEAASRFSYVTVGAQDATRADPRFLEEFCRAVTASPAIRLRLADTVGVLTPRDTEALVYLCREQLRGESVEFHAHNDLGMAAANTVAAWQAGARCLSTTVNGIGERAGNASFATVAVALRVACQCDTGLDLRMLCELDRFVADASRRSLPAETPVTGDAVFSHESGIHLSGLRRDRSTYEAFSPELVGHAPSQHLFGVQSGPAVLRDFAERCGCHIPNKDLSSVADQLRAICRQRGTALSPSEAVELASALIKGG